MGLSNHNRLGNTRHNFPDHLADPKYKQSKKWCLQYMKAFNQEYTSNNVGDVFRPKALIYRQWRDTARAKNSIEHFKTRLGSKRNVGKGKKNESYRALNYQMLPIAPKFVKILIDKILERKREVNIKAIDPKSVSEKRQKRYQVEEYMSNQKFLKNIEDSTGIGFETPLPEDIPLPQSREQIPEFIETSFKDRMIIELKDILNLNFESNDLEQIRREVARDTVEIGVGGTRTYIDSNGAIKIRRVIPERLIVNKCKYEDFRDAIRVGEYIEMTIADIKQRWPGQEEEVYRDIANKASHNKYSRDAAYYFNYYNDHNFYPYDHEQIIVLDAEWFSVDNIVQVQKYDANGNVTSFRKNTQWSKDLERKGITDEQYAKHHNDGRKIIRKEIKNVYRAYWIVDTDYIFDYGLKTNMYRASTRISDTKLSYVLYTTEWDSIIRLIEPVIDAAQINWLQYQHNVNNSRPSGLSIEMSAFSDISLTKGGKKMDPKDVLALYMETGNLVWRKKGHGPSSNQFKPIEELKNEINPAAFQHFDNVLKCIDLLRQILGITQVLDAQVDDARIGKAVTEMAHQATEHAIKHFFHADKKIIEGTAQIALQHTQDTISMNGGSVYEEAIGQDSLNFLKQITDLGLREFSLDFDAGYDEKTRDLVNAIIQKHGDRLDPDIEFEVINDDNPYRALQTLKNWVKKKKEEEQQAQTYAIEAEKAKNIESANAAAEAKIKELTVEYDLKIKYEEKMSAIKLAEKEAGVQLDILMLKIEKGLELNEKELELANKLDIEEIKGDYALEKQALANERKATVKSETS